MEKGIKITRIIPESCKEKEVPNCNECKFNHGVGGGEVCCTATSNLAIEERIENVLALLKEKSIGNSTEITELEAVLKDVKKL